MPGATIGELATLVKGKVVGDAETVVHDGQAIERAKSNHITFADNFKNFKKLAESQAAAAVIPYSLEDALSSNSMGIAYILVENPQEAFLKIVSFFRPIRQRVYRGISEKAEISPRATLGENVSIGPYAVIEEDVVLGDGCDIGPGVYLEAGCRLGANVTIYANVVIYRDVIIGNRVTIHANAVIGADGFGYRLVNGRHERLPHFGSVRIGDDVEIGACATIDRSLVGDTIIGEGTKIDNLVLIAHNCELGKHNIMIGQTGLAGSVTSGDYVVCAGQAGIADHVHLGEGSVVSSQAGVAKSIPPGVTHMGSPSVEVTEARKGLMAIRRLPAMRITIRDLESKVNELSKQLAELTQANNSSQDSPGDKQAA
ncbi:MAG: UDP-3-O-(3-hydroxymyristoyl)glucosamine N-acyltransferase [Planctomycetaceae bacterium]